MIPATPRLNHNKIAEPIINVGIQIKNGIIMIPSKNSKSEDIRLDSFPDVLP